MIIRAVLVEGEPFLMEALCDFLEGCGVDVVVRSHDVPSAIRAMAGLSPDVVLLGSGVTTGCGPDPARTISQACPTVSVVTLAVPGHGSPRGAPSASGSAPGVSVDADPTEFIETIRHVGAKAQYRLTWS